ncbi:MAG: hypothetical protein JWM68_4052 [Verrucomicrobiales bacterium]|nr:hypothetical protein [Verrucomicrobiales bacterium]
MKIFALTIAATLVWCCCNGADDGQFEKLGIRFTADTVVWNVPTNRIKTNVFSYKVVLSRFDDRLTADLLKVANLQATDRLTRDDSRFGEGAASYENAKQNRFLGIYPTSGWIYYLNRNAVESSKKAIIIVPGEEEAVELAVRQLGQLGFKREELAVDEHNKIEAVGMNQQETRLNKSTGEREKRILSRTVFLFRQKDGISFSGLGNSGGAQVEYGNFAALARLEIVWRDLKRFNRCANITKEDLLKRIKNGSAIVGSSASDHFKSLTLTDLKYHYLEYPKNTPQEMVFPYVELEAQAVSDLETNKVFLFLPLR